MSYISRKDGNYYEGDKQYGDIDVPKRPSHNHIWQDEWVLPAIPLATLKQTEINKLEADYEAARYAPIDYIGTTFQADKVSQDLITEVLVAAGGTMPLGFMWRDANNVATLVEGNLLQGLAAAILMRAQPLFWTKSAIKDAINACLTPEDLDLLLNPAPVTPPEPLP